MKVKLALTAAVILAMSQMAVGCAYRAEIEASASVAPYEVHVFAVDPLGKVMRDDSQVLADDNYHAYLDYVKGSLVNVTVTVKGAGYNHCRITDAGKFTNSAPEVKGQDAVCHWTTVK